jgi:hypothetical protein
MICRGEGDFVIPLTTLLPLSARAVRQRRSTMKPDSPWAQWDRTKVGSLKRRQDRNHTIAQEDLVLILESNPDLVPDELFREYLLLALCGKLRKPRGRPQSKLPISTLIAADVWIELEAEDIRKGIAAGTIKRTRGDHEPMKLAADHVASRLGNITGAHLRNEISAIKNGRL